MQDNDRRPPGSPVVILLVNFIFENDTSNRTPHATTFLDVPIGFDGIGVRWGHIAHNVKISDPSLQSQLRLLKERSKEALGQAIAVIEPYGHPWLNLCHISECTEGHGITLEVPLCR